jgi:nucleoside 2-deoxyribosyltransferase
MAKRFYLATRKDRDQEANALSQALTDRGWKRTFVWSAQDGAGASRHAEIAVQELNGVREADVLVVLLPGGFGTHVEIGAALALGKPVILCAPNQKTLETPYPCVFHYHPNVRIFVSETLDVDMVVRIMELCTGTLSAQ